MHFQWTYDLEEDGSESAGRKKRTILTAYMTGSYKEIAHLSFILKAGTEFDELPTHQKTEKCKIEDKMDFENNTINIDNSSVSTNFTEENISSAGEKPVTVAIFICLGIIGCLGNGFVLVIFCSSEKLRQSIVNIYLMNQSAIDLMASLMIIVTAKGVRKATDLSPDRIEGKFYFWFVTERSYFKDTE